MTVTNGAARRHLFTDMADDWRPNVGAFLFAKCRYMHLLEAAYEGFGVCAPAAQYLALFASGAPPTAQLDPYDWLVATPFFTALRAAQPDMASDANLRAWAEAARARWAIDPDAVLTTLPQDTDRPWNAWFAVHRRHASREGGTVEPAPTRSQEALICAQSYADSEGTPT